MFSRVGMDIPDSVNDWDEKDVLTAAENTLLAHIVPLYGKTEVMATEALRYILQQSEAARKALESILINVGLEVGSLTRFQTEVTGEEGERVDLVCYDASGTERVLIEAKFWAGLTDNQPNTYLARLPEDTHSALMLVAPAQRIETLWPELCRRAGEQHELSVTPDAPTSGEVRGVSVGSNGHKMLAVSWRAVLEQMESRASTAGDGTAVRDIEQLHGLTERMDSDAFLPIHADELGPEIPRRISNYLKLVNAAATRMKESDLVGWSGPLTSSWGSNGIYMRLGDAFTWFGVDYNVWSQLGDSPLWLQLRYFETFEDDVAKSRLSVLDNSGRGLIEYDGGWWIPIDLPTGVEEADVLKSVVTRLESVGSLLSVE